tara:strand:- start:19839 stop:20108 length:270 start_codon:yes stop_codon:yes gene_type:complete
MAKMTTGRTTKSNAEDAGKMVWDDMPKKVPKKDYQPKGFREHPRLSKMIEYIMENGDYEYQPSENDLRNKLLEIGALIEIEKIHKMNKE